MTAVILRGDARNLPLEDASVDLIVTSPPYFGLRSYQDGGEHYDGQIGAEATPAEFLAALWACTREWMRVLKPTGSLWLNLGDKYSNPSGSGPRSLDQVPGGGGGKTSSQWHGERLHRRDTSSVPAKSLMGLPWRYALGCIDDLGLILRAEIIWDKPNGLPESVTDRVRRSHEHWFHMVKQPRYFAAVDEIREPHQTSYATKTWAERRMAGHPVRYGEQAIPEPVGHHPLGKLPGSVWKIPTQPLKVPAELGIDHFACVDTETEILTRRGWLRHDQVAIGDEVAGHDLDTGVTTWTRCHGVHQYDYDGDLVSADGRGLSMRLTPNHRTIAQRRRVGRSAQRGPVEVIEAAQLHGDHLIPRSVDWSDDGREKSTALVADVLGRRGISVDMSADYCRLAKWRTTDPGERARALGVPKPPPEPKGMDTLFDLGEAS